MVGGSIPRLLQLGSCVLILIDIDQLILVACRILVAHLRSRGLGVADAFLGIVFDQLTRLSGLREQLVVGPRGLIQRRVLPELSFRRYLSPFCHIHAVPEDVGPIAVRIVDQGKVVLTAQLCAPLCLTLVLKPEEATDDLLLASFLHISNSDPPPPLTAGETGILYTQ